MMGFGYSELKYFVWLYSKHEKEGKMRGLFLRHSASDYDKPKLNLKIKTFQSFEEQMACNCHYKYNTIPSEHIFSLFIKKKIF